MESESIVYGCIRDWPGDSMERRMRRAANRRVLDSLPGSEAWPFLGREMFSRCEQSGAGLYQTQIIHFGASYQAIEYEWSLWVEQFEALLRRLYWASAVVHLETEVNGSHTFRWESERGFHTPQESDLQVRCAWEREGGRRRSTTSGSSSRRSARSPAATLSISGCGWARAPCGCCPACSA